MNLPNSEPQLIVAKLFGPLIWTAQIVFRAPAPPLQLTRKVAEGTRGLFYTIGRSSLPAADTLRRRRKKKNKKKF